MTICFAAGESMTPFMAVLGKTPSKAAKEKTYSKAKQALTS